MSPDLVQCFCQVTGADEQTAISFLSACNENLDNAVSLFLDDPNSIPSLHEEYRTPIPQRTERLVPLELPTLSRTSVSFHYRNRRRAFVGDDSDEEDPPASVAVVESQRIPSITSAATSVEHPPIPSQSVQSDYPASAHTSPTSTTVLSVCAGQNGLRDSKAKKRDYLRQLYQPPTELLFRGTLTAAQAEARERKRWLLVSLHDEECFDCHLLNRDVWKDPRIYQIIKRNFIFFQVPVDSPDGLNFQSRHSYVSSASHIAILDPFTSEQKVMWIHLKDPQSVHAVLTEFLKRSKLDDNELHSAFDTYHGIRRTLSTDSYPSSSRPPKRPRIEQPTGTAGLSSRVAAVSLSDEPCSNSTTVSSSALREVGSESVAHSKLLDLTEEEQLRLAIEASKCDDHSLDAANAVSRNNLSHSNYLQTTDYADDLIVLTDDGDESEEPVLSDDNGSPDCFIFDPDAASDSVLSTTASISSRRPLRPCVDSTTAAMKTTTTVTNKPLHHSTLPTVNPVEDAVELVVRLPTGDRLNLRLLPTLTLQDLRKHFASCGFPEDQYEIVRLYPRINLSVLPGQTTLRDSGLAKKDTIFLQDR